MKMTLTLYGKTVSIEDDTHEDFTADELKEMFSELLVSSSFPASVIEPRDGGRWEYKEDD